MKKGFLKNMRAAAALSCFPALILLTALAGCSGKSEQSAPSSAGKGQAAEAEAARQKPDLEIGKEIYFKYCHYCHGQKGYGDGPVGIALSPHPADFVTDEKRMSKTDQELFKSITEGIHKDIGGDAMSMPRWQEILSEHERWSVLAYIRHLEQEGKNGSSAANK